MQETCFLDESVIVATILNTKNKHHFLEKYVTVKECNIISSLLMKLFVDSGLDVCISNEIDRDSFEILDGIIIINLKKGINLNDIKNKYIGCIPSVEVMNIIWDDSLIYSYLCDIRCDNKKLSFEPSKLDEIVDRILDDPKMFYENIARELSEEEYEYLKRKVEIKSCKNCTSFCSNDKKRYICESWSNDELIGRAKVKKYY